MPTWQGKWLGGRFYLDDQQRPVYFIERMSGGVRRSIRLKTHDLELALADLSHFERDPYGLIRSLEPVRPQQAPDAIAITLDRINLHMASIHDRVKDYRNARARDLDAWANWVDSKGSPIDLRTVDRLTLRAALASFKPNDSPDKRRTGGFKRRVESLNAFCNWLVSDGQLPSWVPLKIDKRTQAPANTRAERADYTPEDFFTAWTGIEDQAIRDVLRIRISTGMHDTEIQQLHGAKLFRGTLPDRGVGIRTSVGRKHEIAGVLQFKQKTKPRHRTSVDQGTLEAALRLQEGGVPSRYDTYNACNAVGIVPSNLRHTFTTLRGQATIVNFEEGGVSLDQVAEILGHRVGSSMTGSRYDKLQVPPLMKLPLRWSDHDVRERESGRAL